jgi:hypothetical protein
VIDLDDIYAGQDIADMRLAEWDDHPNTHGHALIAARLYDELGARAGTLLTERDPEPASRTRRSDERHFEAAKSRSTSSTEFLPGETRTSSPRSTPLISGGILDSIATLKLVMFFEERYGVTSSRTRPTRSTWTPRRIDQLLQSKLA